MEDTSSLIRLRQLLTDYFSNEELRTLCFDLGVDYEDLPAAGKGVKARELIIAMQRRDRLDELIRAGQALRPNVLWPDVGERPVSAGEAPRLPEVQLRYLEKQRAELQRKYDALSKRIAALDTDLGREFDSERKLVLEYRRSDLIQERDAVTADLAEVEQRLGGIPPTVPQAAVFVSYGRESRSWVIEWLVPRLEKAGIRVVVDYRDFTPGEAFISEIERAVLNSRSVCIAITPEYVQGEWRTIEGPIISRVNHTPDFRVIPLLLEETSLPPWLSVYTYLDFTKADDWNTALDRLIVTLGGRSQAPVLEPPTGDLLSASAVRSVLIRRFSLNDLQVLAQEAGLDVSRMRTQTVAQLATDLVTEAERQRKLPNLVRVMRVQQPMLRIVDETLVAMEATRPVRDFLSNAGFEFASVDDPSDFLAMPRTTYWWGKFPAGLYVRVLSDVALSPSDVQATCERASKHTQHALMVINRQPDDTAWMRVAELRANNTHPFFLLPIDDLLVRESYAQGNERATFQTYIEKKLGKAYDPFDSRDPVSDVISFFGREVLTEEIAGELRMGQRVGLFGIHKMGKSSILQRLKKQLKSPVAYIYLQPNDSLAELYQRVLQQWKTDLQVKWPNVDWQPPETITSSDPSEKFQEAAHNLLRKLEQFSDVLLLSIFLDEVDLWMPKGDDQKATARYINLMHCLRKLQHETNRLSLLVAGIHPKLSRVNLLSDDVKNPMFQVVTERFLGPFSREECRLMILSLSRQAFVTFTESGTEAIYRASGGHPYLARRLCSLAWKLHGDIGRIPRKTVDQAISNFVRDPATNSYFDDTALWGELTRDTDWGEEGSLANSSVLRDLARSSSGLTEPTIAPNLDRLTIERALLALAERSVIRLDPKTGKYHISFGLFQDWIRRYKQ